MILPKFTVDDIIKNALKEDINYIDVATDLTLSDKNIQKGVFLAKASGVLCGIDVALRVFELLYDGFEYSVYKKDGDAVEKGDIIAEVKGPVTFLLKGERTALNLLQHMSGIATETAKCVGLVSGTNASIADTRKTLPGLRALQKYAVVCGGGKNHRFNLSDCAMLKDNHIDACGGITKAVGILRQTLGHTVKIEVETRNLDEVKETVEAGADIIMLDNMDNATMKAAVELIGRKGSFGGLGRYNPRHHCRRGKNRGRHHFGGRADPFGKGLRHFHEDKKTMIILCVDYGDARTGLAVCDKSEILASPVGTVFEKDKTKLMEKIAETAKQRKAELIVVGDPLNMDGSRGFRSQECREFAEQLSAFCGIPFEMCDERLTTVAAHNALNVTDTRGKKRKKVVDTLSAVMILEGFMARRKSL